MKSRFTTAPEKRTIYYFTVTGRGHFPIDMLRYDCAWPSSSEDCAKVEAGSDNRERRSVRMGCAAMGGPTIARWASFGWSVGDAA